MPPGKLAAVVTHLEMTAPVPLRRESAVAGFDLRRVAEPEIGWYRELYARVGGPYLWAWRLAQSDEALRALLRDPLIENYVLCAGVAEEGLLELDFRTAGECEIIYFGVTQAFVGTGAARFMMNRALERAWSQPIRRLWLHTCTLDHPRAVPFYVRSAGNGSRRTVLRNGARRADPRSGARRADLPNVSALRAGATLLATLLSFATVYALCVWCGAGPQPAILAAILAIGVSRRARPARGSRVLFAPLVVCGITLAAGGVGWLLHARPLVGAGVL